MSDNKQILVFHRNGLFRDCLASFLARDGGYVAKSIDHMESDDALELLRDAADVLLLDLNLPDNMAVDIARAIRDQNSATKVIVLVPDDHDRLVECIAAGVHGCVLERSSLDDLRDAIRQVLQGETFCSPDIVATMFAEFARIATIPTLPPSEPKERRLTSREQEVLALVAKRKSNKEIASVLCVSLFTVKNHVHNILEKLNVESRQEAVEIARKQL
ncbi:response regulator transcription factor [Roseimaritima ulvae]|uniref:Transcriptional regulatory protein DegU n=1 Tax=Roseimaritima ulvae TaxID=980254 RepID=A0A5B9QU39_9BACT|nr:response regulator transcription factor [Roseimaritima ulvae]QEG42524.1 Transcriptional regulatory protein DegU [Roseimaritima ulvae]